MRTVLVVAVMAMIGVATFFLTRDEEVASVAPPAPPSVEVAPPPKVEAPAERAVPVTTPVDAAVEAVAVVDAGVVPTQVVFDVRRDGVYAVGTRVTVSRDGHDVSGLVNVMGGLTLPLEPGVWRVHGAELTPHQFVVGAVPRVVALELRVKKTLSGRVVDVDDKPVANVVIEATGDTSCPRASDAKGRFECSSWESTVEVRVEDREFGSESVTASLPIEHLTLVVEPKYPVAISFQQAGITTATAQVSHRLGHSFFECEDSRCIARAPTGAFSVVAVSGGAQGLFVARARGTQGKKGSRVFLTFSPAKAIQGVVKNAEGTLLADVPLELKPAMNVATRGAYALTSLSGAFEFSPLNPGSSVQQGVVMPSWRITPMAPWTGETKYVTIGDAPITLVAEVPGSAPAP